MPAIQSATPKNRFAVGSIFIGKPVVLKKDQTDDGTAVVIAGIVYRKNWTISKVSVAVNGTVQVCEFARTAVVKCDCCGVKGVSTTDGQIFDFGVLTPSS